MQIRSGRLCSDVCDAGSVCRRTHAALEMWKEMGDKASTPSTVALSSKAAKTGQQATPAARLAEGAGDVADPAPVAKPAPAAVVAK